MASSSNAARAIARSGGESAFRRRQRDRILAYWRSPAGAAHKRRLRDRPIALKVRTI